MRWIISNDRRPATDGIYFTEDSEGARSVTPFEDGQWRSDTGHPVAKWIDETIVDEDMQEIMGSLPLTENHICFDRAHNMFSVYIFHNHQSSWGKHKCSRCGYEEEWQYDFQYTNPMYQQNQ